jgi:hypothetical protein
MAEMPILDYRPVMPRGAWWAGFARGTMLSVAVAAILLAGILTFNPLWPGLEILGGGAIGTPASPINSVIMNRDSASQWAYLPRAMGYFAVFLVSQWLFLMPRGAWRIEVATDSPPTRRSAIAAALIGTILSIGVLATLMELPNWWLKLTTESGIESPQHFGIVWAVMVAMWAGWAIVFWSYMQSVDRYTALRKVFRWLLAGTIVEMLIAVPAHAWILSQRGEKCYCERGTWTGVAFGVTATLWLFGPGVFLLYMRERRRRDGLI